VIKAEFSASLLQSSVSHDPSQITLIWWLLGCILFFRILWLKRMFNSIYLN